MSPGPSVASAIARPSECSRVTRRSPCADEVTGVRVVALVEDAHALRETSGEPPPGRSARARPRRAPRTAGRARAARSDPWRSLPVLRHESIIPLSRPGRRRRGSSRVVEVGTNAQLRPMPRAGAAGGRTRPRPMCPRGPSRSPAHRRGARSRAGGDAVARGSRQLADRVGQRLPSRSMSRRMPRPPRSTNRSGSPARSITYAPGVRLGRRPPFRTRRASATAHPPRTGWPDPSRRAAGSRPGRPGSERRRSTAPGRAN